MGSYWVQPDFRDCIIAHGAEPHEVTEEPGWLTRSRGSGGFEAEPYAVGVHHDAGTEGNSLENRLGWSLYNPSNSAKPIGNCWIHYDRIHLCCAGATNTQGKSTPYNGHQASKGWIPKDDGNRWMWSAEASNNGVGEVWKPRQLELYDIHNNACREYFNLEYPQDLFTHWEYTTRKIDPWGPTPDRDYGQDQNDGKWTSERMTYYADQALGGNPGSGDDMVPYRMRWFDTRANGHGPLKHGEVYIPALPSAIPQGVKAVFLNLQTTDTTHEGYLKCYTADDSGSSENSLTAGVTNHNTCLQVVGSDRKVIFKTFGSCQLVVDIQGYQL